MSWAAQCLTAIVGGVGTLFGSVIGAFLIQGLTSLLGSCSNLLNTYLMLGIVLISNVLLVPQGLYAGYGKIPMLLDVSLTIRKGECVGLWGHNGMGKSTLMRTLMGYLPTTAGTIIAGKNDLTLKPVQARAAAGIGYVPQGRERFPALSIMDNLC
ncbi:ATP-binding cassette domain-containing protein [bacterium]|nr:ATP-binding cassette domain-containing protein [bacterium]